MSIRDTAVNVAIEAQVEYLAQIAESYEGQVARTRNVLAAACLACGGEIVVPPGTFETLLTTDSLETWSDEAGFHIAVVRGEEVDAERVEKPAGPAATAAEAEEPEEIQEPAPERERMTLGREPAPIPPPIGLVEDETILSDGGADRRTGPRNTV